MKTRQQYLDKEITHREYYSQFVTFAVKDKVKERIGMDQLKASTDPNFNDIRLSLWDSLNLPIDHWKLLEAGDYLTEAVHVCIGKEAARQLVEETN